MNISSPFIARPIATALLMLAVLLAGIVAYPLLPIAALPNVNYPTLQVTAQLPGTDPETMAASVATPLETQFGEIPGLRQMSSASALGYTQITLQFDLSRPIDGAVADTLSAINAANAQLPLNMPYPPMIRKVNPADTPIIVLALTSDTLPITIVDAFAENILMQKLSQISGVGLVGIAGQQKPAVRVQVDPQALAARGISLEDVRSVISQANVLLPKGTLNSPRQSYTLNTNDQLLKPGAYDDLILAYRNGSPVRVKDIGRADTRLPNPSRDFLQRQKSARCTSLLNGRSIKNAKSRNFETHFGTAQISLHIWFAQKCSGRMAIGAWDDADEVLASLGLCLSIRFFDW